MIVDTSALLAVIFREVGWEQLVDRMSSTDVVAAGTPTLAETGIVLTARLGPAADGVLERLLDELKVQEIPFGEVHWREAVDAYRRFGSGRHSAGLGLAECMTYAAARLAGRPLLATGDHFHRTDSNI